MKNLALLLIAYISGKFLPKSIIHTEFLCGIYSASSSALHIRSPTAPLKRTERDILTGIKERYQELMNKIIQNCKANDLDEQGAAHLQELYDKMRVCISENQLYSISRDEYIQHITRCSQDARRATTTCLRSNQKWFPDFALNLAISIVNFLYEYKKVMIVEIPYCLAQFKNFDVQLSYAQCLLEHEKDSTEYRSSTIFSDTPEELCRKFLRTSECFSKVVNLNCDMTPTLTNFVEEFAKSRAKPCEYYM
ncbi:unnamed protein product [Phyllotreta striolata]|uniref:DUF19 domain-containing protein n=1 Tax=Phyllotreta striolata TaxID=444603 RepID=A0A9N9TKA3_PHYSR|nr:unnamed protein product [Phyllotreta striolata]